MNRQQSFVQGAIILAVAGIVSRLFGMGYRFVLPVIIGDEGVGLYQYAYPIYTTILSISAIGIPIAISKLVSEKTAKGNGAGAVKVVQTAFWMLLATGLFFSVVLYAAAPFYAETILRDSRAVLSIRAIAPAIFFVSIMSTFRGLFQGLQRMTPYGVSQVVEQIFRVSTIVLGAWLLIPYGVSYGAAGATFGAVTGGVAGLLYLIWEFWRKRPAIWETLSVAETTSYESYGSIIRRIIRLAVPVSLAGLVFPLINFIDSVVVPSRLHAAGLGEVSTKLYGILTGEAMIFINAPTVITSALAVSLVPAISEALATDQWDLIRRRAAAGLRITFLLMIPASVGLTLLAEAIPTMLWQKPDVGPPLAVLGIGVLFLTLQQTSSGVLQGLGRPDLPVRHLLTGGAFKVVLTWYLTALPNWNILGAALGTVIGFAVSSMLNVYQVHRRVGGVLDWRSMIVKPVVGAMVMVPAVWGSYTAMLRLEPLLAEVRAQQLATLTAIMVGVVTYGIVLLLTGGVRTSDLRLLPRVGPALAERLERLERSGFIR